MKIIKLLLESRFGYKIGSSNDPAETLQSRSWTFNSRLGYLGTGDYFYGDLENAKKDRRFLRRKSEDIQKIDLQQYKLYRPENPENFYDILKLLTQEIGEYANAYQPLSEEELDDALEQLHQIITGELHLNIPREQSDEIINKFISDVQKRKKGSMLANRLLGALGYQGIDNTDTPLDNYGVGSIIFREV